MDQDLLTKMVKNFKERNIDVLYFESIVDLKKYINDLITTGDSVGIGNSKTLKDLHIAEELTQAGFEVIDKTLARSQGESTEMKKKSLIADCYITGSNAISVEGQIVNIDHSGNRVAAMIYGPDKVIIIVGSNKITKTLAEAINRAKNIAAPLNARRAGYNPPCVELNRCVDCNSTEKVCNYLTIIEGQTNSDRLKICIIEEEMGF